MSINDYKIQNYHIMTFGCGGGDGTGLFVSYPARRDCGWRFPANKGKEAVTFLEKIAAERGDTNCIGVYKPSIICYEIRAGEPNPFRVRVKASHSGA